MTNRAFLDYAAIVSEETAIAEPGFTEGTRLLNATYVWRMRHTNVVPAGSACFVPF